jgi:hypothetical protein
MNETILLLDSTLLNFPRQKEIINFNEKTFIKNINVIYTDEDLYNISYVDLINRSITGNETYKFNFIKIPSSIISQKKLTPDAIKALNTTDVSNVFMIITIAYPQQFLNILSNNITYSSQILFLSDTFTPYNLKLKLQLPYAYTLINVLEPANVDYYQRILFNNNSGYITHYTVSLLQFLTARMELINNSILYNLSIKDLVQILEDSNDFIKSQPVNNIMSLLQINYSSKTVPSSSKTVPISSRKQQRKPVQAILSSKLTLWAAAAAAALAAKNTDLSQTLIPSTSTVIGSVVNLNSFALYNLIVPENDQTNLNNYKMYINGLNYIKNKYYEPDSNIHIAKILQLLYFINTTDFNEFIITIFPRNTLYYYFINLRYNLLNFNKNTSQIIPSNSNIIVNIDNFDNEITMTKSEFFIKFVSFINNIFIRNIQI